MDIIKIERANHYNVSDFTDEVILIPEGSSILYGDGEPLKLERDLEKLARKYGHTWSPVELYKSWLKARGISREEDIKSYMDEHYDFNAYNKPSKEELADVEYDYEDNMEYNTRWFIMGAFSRHKIGGEDGLNELLGLIGLKTGVIRNMFDWTRYIAGKDVDTEFIDHLYRGNYIFRFEHINEHGKVLDTLISVYATSTEEIKETIESNFNVGEKYYLLEDDLTIYMDVPKVRLIEKVTYSFKIIN